MNELESALGSVKTAEPTQKKSWIHSMPHKWLRLEEQDGNCDQLPSRLTPKTGCPKCGAVWLSVKQVAFVSTCSQGRLVDWRLAILQIGHIEPPMAVRLECGGDHLVEFDGLLLTVVELPNWGMLAVGMLGLYGIAFAYKEPPQ
jgi:hypothetical protein